MTGSPEGQPEKSWMGGLWRRQRGSRDPERGLGDRSPGFRNENAMLKGDYLRQVVKIVNGGVPTVHEVCSMCLFMSLRRILLQRSLSMNLFDTITHELDLLNVEVSIQLIGNIYPRADMIQEGVYFEPLLGPDPSLSICYLEYLLLIHKSRSGGIGIGLCLVGGSPK